MAFPEHEKHMQVSDFRPEEASIRDAFKSEVNRLVNLYFSDADRMQRLNDGDILLREGESNDKIYYVHDGGLRGFSREGEDFSEAVFAAKGDLIGIRSFFDGQHRSYSTVVSEGDSLVSWVRMGDVVAGRGEPPERILMPLFIHAMERRKRVVYELMRLEQQEQARASELEQVLSLGQFAAGVAHELNNALAVIARGSDWVATALDRHMGTLSPLRYALFQAGIRKGRMLSSRQSRAQAKSLQQRLKLEYPLAMHIARMGLDPELEQRLLSEGVDGFDDELRIWEMGATFRDLMMAAEHASHVVESMKSLGTRASVVSSDANLMQTIDTALSILRNVTKDIDIILKPSAGDVWIRGNKGELVQVWTNLIRNACEAMLNAAEQMEGRKPMVEVQVSARDDQVIVRISDNGPGIAAHVLPNIFLPDFTTKRSGLMFGLGLSIVKKIISAYNGSVKASSTGKGAVMTVTLPISLQKDG